MAGITYSPTDLVNFEPGGPGFEVVVMGNGHKGAALLHDHLWFLGRAEP